MDELNILLFGKYPGFFKDKLLEIINSINPNIKNTFTNDFKNLQNKIDVTNPDLFIFLIPNQFENSKTTLEFITTTSYNLKLIVISEDYNFELSNTLFIHPISDYLWLKDIKRSYSILKKEIQLLSNHFHNKNKKELDNLFFSGLEIISTDSYLILDPFSLKISYCSQNIYNLIGVTKEEILEYSSEDLKDLIYQKDLNKLQNLFFQIQSSGFIDFPELNIRVKSKLIGGYKIISFRATFFSGEQNKLLFIIIKDVTNEDYLEKKAIETESLFQTIFLTLKEGVIISDPYGNIVECNPSAEKILKLTKNQIQSMSRFDKDLIIVDEKLNPLTSEDSPIYSTLKYKKGIKNKIVGLKKNNKIKWFYINTNIIKSNSSEEIKGVILSFNDFTDLKEAIDTLEESDRFISTVLDSVEEGLLVTDENGKIETANNKIYNLFEFEKSSLIGRYINLIIDSEIFTFFTRDKSEFNLFGYKSDKSKFPIHISYSKATFQNKPIFIFVIRNLNPKIQLEKDFSENTFSEKEKEFREMTLNVPGVIFQFSVRDRNFHIEYISPKLKDIFGIKLSEDDFLFRNNKIQIYNKKYFLSNLISNIRRKLPINLELHFKSENKKDYYSNIIANPFILNTKDTIYNGVMIDITDSKETEKRLEEQRHLFRSLFNFSPIGKAIMDTEGGFYNSNIALHNIIGYNREELEYTNIFDLLEEPDKIKEKELLENFNNGKIHEIKLEHNIINKNKELKKIYRHMVSLLDEKGKLIFIICAFIDLTKQKNLEEKLTQNKKMESIGNFASSIAHDFNNLIQPILMYSGILKNDIKLNNIPDKKDLFEIIDKVHFSADRAKKLVSQILDFSKKGGKYHITLNLKNLILESMENIQVLYPNENVNLQYLFEDKEFFCKTDPLEIHQILLNLFINSIHAMKENNEKVIKIYLHTIEDSTINDNQTSDKFHILKFEDNGKGIEKEKLNLIFDPFYTDKKGEGTGLGLSIIYGIVKRMNGEIQVFSTKNKGSIFSLYLPAEDPPKLNLP